MQIISFAWTSGPLLSGMKDVTRRFWSDKFAEQFRAGTLVQAYDKNPRVGGEKIGLIRLTKDPYKQYLRDMTDEDEKREGGMWGSAAKFVEMMGGPDLQPWVVEFELVEVC